MAGEKVHRYRDDFPIPLDSGTSAVQRRVVELPTLRVELLVDPADPRARDDRFILRSDDGAYERSYGIDQDKVPGDERVTFDFDELLPGKLYALVHDEGTDGVVTMIFEGRTFGELFGDEGGEPVPPRFDPTQG